MIQPADKLINYLRLGERSETAAGPPERLLNNFMFLFPTSNWTENTGEIDRMMQMICFASAAYISEEWV